MWDERYATDEYLYGTEANTFLTSVIDRIPPGRVLCLAEGEGRNAVWLAEQGRSVTAVDASPVGLDKAKLLEPDGPVFGRWLDAASMRQLLLVSAAGSGSDRR